MSTQLSWEVLTVARGTPVDAVEAGCSVCEDRKCGHSVGYGGRPDENGETTLDAMIMDGTTHNVGSVACLRRIKQAISVARHVMERTNHTLLVGNQATEFAKKMGFKEEDITSNKTIKEYIKWKMNNCQPNFWHNVLPNPSTSCGPYRASKETVPEPGSSSVTISEDNHDTVGMIAIDANGRIAAGTSTNGLSYKIPGRVGDSPIPGSGAYADKDIGAAAATGNGDIMMRFVPTFLTVEKMRQGLTPSVAAEETLMHIKRYYPSFRGAIIATDVKGNFGAACYGYAIAGTFSYVVANPSFGGPKLVPVVCK